ncbi:MAG: ATP-binding cassette domain-containing protein [Planctomycetota bacterium]
MTPMITLTLQHTVAAHAADSPRTLEVAGMFGLEPAGELDITIVPPTTLTLAPGRIVFITGASGGGKSTLLRLIRKSIAGHTDDATRPAVITLDAIVPPGGLALVDGFDDAASQPATAEVMRWLGLAGLSEARVMLRRPAELSEGQRARLQLAHAVAAAERAGAPWSLVLADELGATLDRPTARAVAGGLRKWAARAGVCIVAATTHDDLLEPLCPDTLVVASAGEAVQVLERDR